MYGQTSSSNATTSQFLRHRVVPGDAPGLIGGPLESTLKDAGLLGVVLEQGDVAGQRVGLVPV